MLQTLSLDPGDLLQIKSTDLPPGKFIKLQPQSPSFLDISDPKAVLENAFRNFAALSLNDIFTFAYNDTTYSIAVLETKPSIAAQGAISVIETDLEVDFAAPVGYEEPQKRRPTTDASGAAVATGLSAKGGMMHSGPGTMAQAINYASIAPASSTAAMGAKAVSSNFLTGGHKLKGGSSSKAPTPKASTPVAGASSNNHQPTTSAVKVRRSNGPQPLRLPPGQLFFGYEIKPVRKAGQQQQQQEGEGEKVKFQGQGQTLRKGGKRGKGGGEKGGGGTAGTDSKEKDAGKTLSGTGSQGRTLRDLPR